MCMSLWRCGTHYDTNLCFYFTCYFRYKTFCYTCNCIVESTVYLLCRSYVHATFSGQVTLLNQFIIYNIFKLSLCYFITYQIILIYYLLLNLILNLIISIYLFIIVSFISLQSFFANVICSLNFSQIFLHSGSGHPLSNFAINSSSDFER